MKNKYRICISSPPDRNNLVAEIFFDDIQWAEVNQERGYFEVEFYPRVDESPWCIDLVTTVGALNEAKRKLEERSRKN